MRSRVCFEQYRRAEDDGEAHRSRATDANGLLGLRQRSRRQIALARYGGLFSLALL
jgi:hypothetical protein